VLNESLLHHIRITETAGKFEGNTTVEVVKLSDTGGIFVTVLLLISICFV